MYENNNMRNNSIDNTDNMEISIDLGSSLCKAIVAKQNAENALEILGVGVSPNYGGVKQGSIINIEQASQSVMEALEEACLQAGTTFDVATVNITGKTVRGENSRGVVAISNRERLVSQDDIFRVIEGAKNIRIPIDQQIIHILSRSYTLDNQEGIHDPVGMTGIRLEAESSFGLCWDNRPKQYPQSVGQLWLAVQGDCYEFVGLC